MTGIDAEHHRTTRSARFRETLRAPATIYLAVLNLVFLGFLGFALLGVAGIALAVGVVAVMTVLLSFSAGSALAGRDFLDRYAKRHGYKVKPRFRLPAVTPMLRSTSIGYAGREFEGELTIGGSSVRFVHASTLLSHPRTFSGLGHRITAFVTSIPVRAPGVVVCDLHPGLPSSFALEDLPRLRRVIPDEAGGELFTSAATAPGFAREVCSQVAGIVNRRGPRQSVQLDDRNLLVWQPGLLESSVELDAALDQVASIAGAISGVAQRTAGRDRAFAYQPRPALPDLIPEPWRGAARRLEFEYWDNVIASDTPILLHRCDRAISGQADGRDVTVGEGEVLIPESDYQVATSEEIVFATTHIEDAGTVPPVSCVPRRRTRDRVPFYALIAVSNPATALVTIAFAEISAGTTPREKLESNRFNERFQVNSESGAENMLRQLLSPAFVHWSAEHPIDDLGWKWDGKDLYVFTKRTRELNGELIVRLADACVRIADRIANEAEEARY